MPFTANRTGLSRSIGWFPFLSLVLVFPFLVSLRALAGQESNLPDLPLICVMEPFPVAGGRVGQGFGSRIVRVERDGSVLPLTGEFASAADPVLSFDGSRLLFSGRRTTGDSWQIWSMNPDGSGLRLESGQLAGDCRDPVWLPRAAVTPPQFDDKVRWIGFVRSEADPGSSLFVQNVEPIPGRDRVLWQSTFSPNREFSPSVLPDGRILYSVEQPDDTLLMTISWAGDNVNLFYRDDQRPGFKSMARALPDRSVVFVEGLPGRSDHAGPLFRVWLKRPLRSLRRLTDDRALYRTPAPGHGGTLLAARSDGPEPFSLVSLDLESGSVVGILATDPAGRHSMVDPVPLVAGPEPVSRIPMLEFASVLDISGFEDAGQMHCMSVYDSQHAEVSRLDPGTVRWVRFIIPGESSPVRVADTGSPYAADPSGASLSNLGEAPVEEDGSFLVNIQGNLPFRVQLLDENRVALPGTMKSWAWVRSGGQRGCIGCHEDKELGPINRATTALIRQVPTRIGADKHGSLPRPIRFRNVIGPLLESRCGSCHRGEKAPGGLLLGGEKGIWAGLLRRNGERGGSRGKLPRIVPGQSRNSPLIWRVMGRVLGDELEPTRLSVMPPGNPLSESERQKLVEWADLDAAW